MRAETAYLASWAAVGSTVAERFPHLAADISGIKDDEPAYDYGSDIALQRKFCAEELDIDGITFTEPRGSCSSAVQRGRAGAH